MAMSCLKDEFWMIFTWYLKFEYVYRKAPLWRLIKQGIYWKVFRQLDKSKDTIRLSDLTFTGGPFDGSSELSTGTFKRRKVRLNGARKDKTSQNGTDIYNAPPLFFRFIPIRLMSLSMFLLNSSTGVLGYLEELRDAKINHVVSYLQVKLFKVYFWNIYIYIC